MLNEYFKYRSVKDKYWCENIESVTTSLTTAIALETARWHHIGLALKVAVGKEIKLPLAPDCLQFLAQNAPEGSYLLLQHSLKLLDKNSTVADFVQMRDLMRQYLPTLAPDEAGEIYIAAINFCIRQINLGERSFMQEAFMLYQEGLESRALLVRGNMLPSPTYYNVHVLAHRCGERAWAIQFLDTYQAYLPKAERQNFYQYNLAIYSFMLEDYQAVLGRLLNVHFNEVYLNAPCLL
jgi:hypothetical protein